MQSEVAVAPIPESTDPLAVSLLARAFRDNPLDVAVIGGSPDRRLRSVGWGMRSTLAAARRSPAARLLGAYSGDPEMGPKPLGCLLAIPSIALPLPPAPLLGQLRSTVGQGLRAIHRWGQVFRVLERNQMRGPHWYLSLIGVDPPRQGHGIGRRLLDAWLAAIDPDGLPSYLETDREENVAFYARAGFVVVTELEVLDTPLWCMSRPPASPRGDAS